MLRKQGGWRSPLLSGLLGSLLLLLLLLLVPAPSSASRLGRFGPGWLRERLRGYLGLSRRRLQRLGLLHL